MSLCATCHLRQDPVELVLYNGVVKMVNARSSPTAAVKEMPTDLGKSLSFVCS